METKGERQTYLEQKREAILSLGYDYISFRNRTKKSLIRIKHIIKNNARHFEEAYE